MDKTDMQDGQLNDYDALETIDEVDGETNQDSSNFSDVTSNANLAELTVQDEKELPTTGHFSRDYYQLLVYKDDSILNDKMALIPKERVLREKKVPKEIYERCHTFDKKTIDMLKDIPAIVCVENNVPRGKRTTQKAWLCALKAVQQQCNGTTVIVDPIGSFDQSLLCDERNAVYFDIEYDDLFHTHWSVKNRDVFDAIKEIGIDIEPI